MCSSAMMLVVVVLDTCVSGMRLQAFMRWKRMGRVCHGLVILLGIGAGWGHCSRGSGCGH